MTRIAKVTVAVVTVAATSLALGIYGLFHGHFDHGRFEIKQVQWSSSKRVAMVAERSDQEALGGITYFVLIGNHVFSTDELRRAYYGQAPVFATGSDCLNLRWENPSKLVVLCNGSPISGNQIDVQKRQSEGTDISYENIAIK